MKTFFKKHWPKIALFLKLLLPKVTLFGLMLGGFCWYTSTLIQETTNIQNKKFDAIQAELAQGQNEMKEYLGNVADEVNNNTDTRFNEIDTKTVESHTTIIKEVENNPRLADENQGLTEGLLTEVNKARGETRK